MIIFTTFEMTIHAKFSTKTANQSTSKQLNLSFPKDLSISTRNDITRITIETVLFDQFQVRLLSKCFDILELRDLDPIHLYK